MAEITTEEWLLPTDLLELVSETNHEISKLAEGIIMLLAVKRNDDFLIYHGMLARIQQLSEIQFFALRLHGDDGEEAQKQWGELATMSKLERLYKGSL